MSKRKTEKTPIQVKATARLKAALGTEPTKPKSRRVENPIPQKLRNPIKRCAICDNEGMAEQVDKLLKTPGNISAAARLAGVSRPTVKRHQKQCLSLVVVKEVLANIEDGVDYFNIESLMDVHSQNMNAMIAVREAAKESRPDTAVKAAVALSTMVDRQINYLFSQQQIGAVYARIAANKGDKAALNKVLEDMYPIPQALIPVVESALAGGMSGEDVIEAAGAPYRISGDTERPKQHLRHQRGETAIPSMVQKPRRTSSGS